MRPTIVLIPGLMNDGAVWAGQVPALSRLGPVVVACNDGADDLGEMAARIVSATAGPLIVVGHSMGGRIALEVVAQAPERVAALALLSTGANGVQEGEAEGRERLVTLAHAHGMAAVADDWLPNMIAPDAPPEVRANVRAMLLRARAATFAAQQHALLGRTDRSLLLQTIACPTLVATGERDGWSGPAQHAAMAGAIRGARLEILAGAGHMLPVEAAERLAELLTELFHTAAG